MSGSVNLTVLGAGAWGTALAVAGVRAGLHTVLWGRDRDEITAMHASRRNVRRLPGLVLPDGLGVTAALEEALAGANLVLLAVPAQALRSVARRAAPLIRPDIPVISCAKGLERGTARPMTAILAEEAPQAVPAVLSGPSFAADVARGLPTAVTIAAPRLEEAERLAGALSGPSFRPYASDDLVGVEIGGALKNVLAIAAGAVEGRGLGKSAQAALIARGFAEMARLGDALGARRETLMGLSGLGDLVLTCSSLQSRNYAFGHALGRGTSAAELLAAAPLAEGAHTASVALALAARHGVDLPIADAVADVVEGRRDIDQTIAALLARPLRPERD